MSKYLALLSLLAFNLSANAAKVSDYVSHKTIKGSSPTQGKWNLDYIQLIARAGHPLSSFDLKINADLENNARQGMCEPSDDPQTAPYSDSNQSTTVTFVSDRLLAISVAYDTSCANAAHPSGGTASAIYDRSTGQIIDISTGKALDADTFTTMSPGFNKVVLREMAKQAVKEKAARGDDVCDEEYQTSSLTFTIDGVALSSKSISVDLSTSHVDQACGFTTVIPLAKFLPVAKKGSVLEQLAKAAAARK